MNTLPGNRNRTFHVYCVFTDQEYAIASDSALNAALRVASEISGHNYVMHEQVTWNRANTMVAVGDYCAWTSGAPFTR